MALHEAPAAYSGRFGAHCILCKLEAASRECLGWRPKRRLMEILTFNPQEGLLMKFLVWFPYPIVPGLDELPCID